MGEVLLQTLLFEWRLAAGTAWRLHLETALVEWAAFKGGSKSRIASGGACVLLWELCGVKI
jgi:hypothetical protein